MLAAAPGGACAGDNYSGIVAGTTPGGIPHAQAPLQSGSLARTVVATRVPRWLAILSPPPRGQCLMARRLTETWNCVTGAIQPDVREGGHHGPPGAARPRDGQPARDGLAHVYYVRRYYDKTTGKSHRENAVQPGLTDRLSAMSPIA